MLNKLFTNIIYFSSLEQKGLASMDGFLGLIVIE